MKIRQGFVSNSSSSCFIIAINEKYKVCPTCGHTEPNFIKKLENSKDSDNCIRAIGDDNICQYIKDNHFENLEQKKLLTLIKNRKQIDHQLYYIELCNNNDYEGLWELMEKYKGDGRIKVLYDSEC